MYYSDGRYIYAALEDEDAPYLWGIYFKPCEASCFTRLSPDFTELPELWRAYKTRDSAEIALLAVAETFSLTPVDERGEVVYMMPQEAYARSCRGVTELVFSDGRFCYALRQGPASRKGGGVWSVGFKARGAGGGYARFNKELRPDRRLLDTWQKKETAEAYLKAIASDYGLILIDAEGRPCGGPWRDRMSLPYRRKARGIIRRAEAKSLMRNWSAAEALAKAGADAGTFAEE